MRARLLLLGLVLGLMALLPASVHAALPGAGTVSQATPTSSWTGGPFLTSNPSGLCLTGDPSCDTYALTIAPPATGSYKVEITITPSAEGDDYDLFVESPSGDTVGSSATTAATSRSCSPTRPRAPTRCARSPGSSRPAARTGQGDARCRGAPPAGDPGSVLKSVRPGRRAGDRRGPAPRRIVGFQPGELNEAKLLGRDPGLAAPGRADPARHSDSSGDASPLFGAETLVNHGRSYYNEHEAVHRPLRVQVEAAGVYAPDASRRASSRRCGRTRPPATSRSRRTASTSRATTRRAASTAAPAQRAPNAPVRFVDGEKTEDWIAANAQAMLGLDFRRAARARARTPATRSSCSTRGTRPKRERSSSPQNEYHVFKVNRTDPDTGEFDGIDWARDLGRPLPLHDGRPRRRAEPVRGRDAGATATARSTARRPTSRRSGSTAPTRRGR